MSLGPSFYWLLEVSPAARGWIESELALLYWHKEKKHIYIHTDTLSRPKYSQRSRRLCQRLTISDTLIDSAVITNKAN